MKLTPEQLRQFLRDGYVVVPNLLSAEQLELLKAETEPMHARFAPPSAPPAGVHLSWEPTAPPRLQQILNAELVSPTLNAALRSPEVLDVVTDLLGPDLALFESKFLMKASRVGGEIPWHQDFSYWWSLTNAPQQVSCLVAIDDADEENGCLRVLPGSHRRGLLPHDVNARTFSKTLRPGSFDPSKTIALPTRGGTAVIFGPLLVHGSSANTSPRERRSLTMVFTVSGLGVPEREVLRSRTAKAPAGWLPALPAFTGDGPHGGQCRSNYRRRELWALAISRVNDPSRTWVEVDERAGDSLDFFAARKPAGTRLVRFERVLQSTTNRDDVEVVEELPADLGTIGLLHLDGEVYAPLARALEAVAPHVGEGTVLIVDDALDPALDAVHEAATRAGWKLSALARADRQVVFVVGEAAAVEWKAVTQGIVLAAAGAASEAPAPPASPIAGRLSTVMTNRVWPALKAPAMREFFPLDRIPCVHGPGPREAHCGTHARRRELWRAAIALIEDPARTWCEFGVGQGESLDWFAMNKPREARLVGFDSFEGIPEPWHAHPAGQWASKVYVSNRPDVEIVTGPFAKTLADAGVVAKLGERIGFLHVDCDLYSSTRTVLEGLRGKIGAGTVIVFDEMYSYPGWWEHEAKAFQERVVADRWRFEYIGRADFQVAVRVVSVGDGPAWTCRGAEEHRPVALGVSFDPVQVGREKESLVEKVARKVKRVLGV
jgi:predicted O-methyltransferase YrrM